MTLCVALTQALVPALGVAWRRQDWQALAAPAACLQCCLALLAYGILTYSFVTHDFSVRYVADNSHSALPLMYRISGVWGAHEGSLLLWTLILAGWTAALAVGGRRYPAALRAGVIAALGWLSVGFLLFTIFTSNPFLRLFPAPADGADLNPLLQDPAMAIHPPLLYMGYVGLAVPFAFALVALAQGQLDAAWTRRVRPWALAAWLCLTAGITLGSWWAYYELGWGGWWFWDPVENASLMPWLTATALIHSLAVTEQRHALRNWTVLLAIASFALSLSGTFLVRSGILTSVHSFAADPTRGVFILAFLGLILGVSFTLFAARARQLRAVTRFRPISREMALLTNSVLQLIAMFTILLGTLYPLCLEALTGARISVGLPYFNQVFIPLMLPVLLLMGVGPLLRWRAHARSDLLRTLRLPAALALGLALLSLVFLPTRPGLLTWLALLLAVWIITSLCRAMQQRLRYSLSRWHELRRIPRGWYGMAGAHLGVALCVIGIALSSSYSQETDMRLAPGEQHQLGPYRFELARVVKRKGPNYLADVGVFKVYKDGAQVLTLRPEKRYYGARDSVMTEAAIDSSLLRDVYVSLGDKRDAEVGAWTVRLYYKPFIVWIWIGGFMMAGGGLLAVTDTRYRASFERGRATTTAGHARPV